MNRIRSICRSALALLPHRQTRWGHTEYALLVLLLTWLALAAWGVAALLFWVAELVS